MRGLKVLAVAAALLVPSVAGAASAPPHVRVSAMSPRMVVRGTGFASHELVAVTVAGEGVKKLRVRATLDGAFRAALVPPPSAACGRYFVRAQGLASKRAATVRLGPADCADPGANSG